MNRLCPPTIALLAACAAGQQPDRPDATHREIAIGVLPGLQYDTPRFAAAPGEALALTLHNRDEMAHNLVLTRPGRREAVVQAALALGERGPDRGFVPESADVLHATAVLAPGEAQTLRFSAPREAGVYPYVCTFPGHGFVMYGALYVGVAMPGSLRDDPHVPPAWRDGSMAASAPTAGLHAWAPTRRPLLYRVFLPDASPAAFALAPNLQVAAAWDATPCRLRYAWHGGFLDPWPVWKGNGNGLATLDGARFATETARPFTIAGIDADAAADFRGYHLVDGHPEFRYRLGVATVRERVSATDDGRGIARRFVVEAAPGPVTLRPRVEGAVQVATDPPLVDGSATPRTVDGRVAFTIELRPTEPPPVPAATPEGAAPRGEHTPHTPHGGKR